MSTGGDPSKHRAAPQHDPLQRLDHPDGRPGSQHLPRGAPCAVDIGLPQPPNLNPGGPPTSVISLPLAVAAAPGVARLETNTHTHTLMRTWRQSSVCTPLLLQLRFQLGCKVCQPLQCLLFVVHCSCAAAGLGLSALKDKGDVYSVMIIGEFGAVWCCWDVIMLSCDGGSEKEWPSFTGLGEKEVFFPGFVYCGLQPSSGV